MLVPLWEYVTYDVYNGKDEDQNAVQLLVRKLKDDLYRLEIEYEIDGEGDDDGEGEVEIEEYHAVTEQTLREIFEEFRVRPKTPVEAVEVLEPVLEVEV